MTSIQKIIWVLIIVVTIGVILWCIFPKRKITESLLVSPIKLYSSNNEQVNQICEIDNNNENQKQITDESGDSNEYLGYADYISISDYLSIKNENPKLRPGTELIGKRIRIKLARFKREYVPVSIQEEEGDCYSNDSEDVNIFFSDDSEEEQQREKTNICGDNKDNNDYSTSKRNNPNFKRNEEVNQTSDCSLSEDEYSTLTTESTDKKYLFSDYHKCENNYCWYDANIINYSMTNYPCSMHKIEWKNQYGLVENKWISLYDYDIEVPVKPHSVYFKNEIGNTSSNNPYYSWKTSMESGYSVLGKESIQDSCTQPLNNNSVENAYLNQNYFGNISCSNNKDCSKYGSLYCDGGYCSTKYIQL